jgi:hypothetical protein
MGYKEWESEDNTLSGWTWRINPLRNNYGWEIDTTKANITDKEPPKNDMVYLQFLGKGSGYRISSGTKGEGEILKKC